MSASSSCLRCSRPHALLSAVGLCPACAATDATADATPADPPADPFGPTATDLPPAGPSAAPTPLPAGGSNTATVPPDVIGMLPDAPPGHALLRRLGGGGMGDVYLARESPSGRRVAIKFLRRPDHPEALHRFVTELRALAGLDHPGIVRVFGSDFLRAVPYFTMEYAAGGSLADALRPAPGGRGPAPLPPADAVRLIRQAAAAVGAANAAGVIHRDLKPSNVLLGAGGTVKVADFGLAKLLDAADGLTETPDTLGTPGYMPPEQVSRRNGEVGSWTDVYGLGATLYHLLTGRPPFVGDSSAAIIGQVLNDPPARPRALRPELPLGLEAVVLKCLAKEPSERYQTAEAFLADLDRCAAGERPVAPPLTRGRRVRRWAARHRRAFGAAAAVLVVVVGAFALGATNRPDPVPAPAPIPDEVRTPDGRVLPFRVRLGHDKSKVTAAADGTVTVSSWGLCLVEYIPPGPRPDQYHLRADVRHEASDIGGRVGLYFAHRTFAGALDDTHLLVQLAYNDVRVAGDTAVAPPIQTASEHRPRLSVLVRAGRPAQTGQTELASGDPFRPHGRRGDRWRAVGLRVGAGGADGSWDGATVGPVAGDRVETILAKRLADVRAGDGRLPIARVFDPRAGCGLLVENSSASFRTVELTAGETDRSQP